MQLRRNLEVPESWELSAISRTYHYARVVQNGRVASCKKMEKIYLHLHNVYFLYGGYFIDRCMQKLDAAVLCKHLALLEIL